MTWSGRQHKILVWNTLKDAGSGQVEGSADPVERPTANWDQLGRPCAELWHSGGRHFGRQPVGRRGVGRQPAGRLDDGSCTAAVVVAVTGSAVENSSSVHGRHFHNLNLADADTLCYCNQKSGHQPSYNSVVLDTL